MSYIYIAYEPVDYALATHVKNVLESAGYTAWFDETRLDPSAHLTQPRVEDIIYSSLAVVGVVPQSGTTPLLVNETGYARSLGKHVFWVQSASDMDAVMAGLERAVTGEGTASFALPRPFDYSELEMHEAENAPPRGLFLIGGIIALALILLGIYGILIAPASITPPSAFTATAVARLQALTLSAVPTDFISATETPFTLPTLPQQSTSQPLLPSDTPVSIAEVPTESVSLFPSETPAPPRAVETLAETVPPTISNSELTLTAIVMTLTQIAVQTQGGVQGGSDITATLTPVVVTDTSALTANTDVPTLSVTATIEPTALPTETIVPTNTDEPTAAPTNTSEPAAPTNTDEPTAAPTATDEPTVTPTDTDVPTLTPTQTATNTFVPTFTPSLTPTPTNTFVPTFTPSWTPTPTNTFVPTFTPTETWTPTATFTPEPTEDTSRLPIGFDNSQWTPESEFVAGIPVLFVPAGCYLAVSAAVNVEPQEVCVSDFWIGQYEVTNRQYAVCVNEGACSAPVNTGSSTRLSYYDNPAFIDFPVINLTWEQASAYATWIGGRLPDEHEWRYAAHGPAGDLYPWGNEPPSASLLNFNDFLQDTAQVGRFPAGASWVGALDMAGNVWEWVNPVEGSTIAQLPDDAVIAGGSWNSFGGLVQANYAAPKPKSQSDVYTGFRVVFDEDAVPATS